MGAIEVHGFIAVCDCCDKPFIYSDFKVYDTLEELDYDLGRAQWLKHTDGKLYCHDCHWIDFGGRVVIEKYNYVHK